MSDDVLRFKLGLEELQVEIEDVDGVVRRYVLKELDGTTRDKYLTSLNRKARRDGKSMKDFDGIQAVLLTECLYEVKADGSRELVKMATIQKWNAKIQQALFDRARKMSGLDDDEAEDEAKND